MNNNNISMNGNPPKSNLQDPRTGRFVKGNPGNPSSNRAMVAQMARLKQAILEAATPEKMKKLADKLYDLGLKGNVRAIQEYFDRAIGKAGVHVDITAHNVVDPDADDIRTMSHDELMDIINKD